MLLVLQFLWFKNAYEMIEKEILEKCKLNLEEAINIELFNRMNNGSNTISISDNIESDESSTIISDISIKNHQEINNNLQEIAFSSGFKCSITFLDSIFNKLNKKNIGTPIDYSIKIEERTLENKLDQSFYEFKLSKNRKKISKRINSNQIIEVSFNNYSGNILFRAKNLFITSLIIVLIIGAVLIYQLITVLNEFKYIQFIKEYVSSVTHDLATPIGNITMSLDLLNMGEFDNDKTVKKLYYTMCIEQGLRQQRKLTRFITVSNCGMTELLIEKDIVNINEYIYSIIDFFNRSSLYSQGRVKFNFTSQNESLDAYIDKDLFDSVIINIIENSIKYTVDDVIITLNCTENKQNTIITIKDNGNGIASKDIENIFEYFKRGKFNNIGKVFGYGIGLSYAKKIVEAHNGKIKVKSELNTGVEFTITLPKS